jgi:hypothetical protein
MTRKLLIIISVAAAGITSTLPSAAAPSSVSASWSPAGSPKQTVLQTGAAVVGNKVYMPGGWKPGFSTAFDKMQILATGSNTWSIDSEPMPVGAMAQGAVCTDGSKVYVVDGIAEQGFLMSSLQIYDPSMPQGSRWSTGPGPSTSHDGSLVSRDGGCAWLGGKLYLFGGQAESSNGTIDGISDFTWVFDPGTGTWSDTGHPMLAKLWVFGYTSNAKHAYVGGGESPTDALKRGAEVFTPSSGWSKLPNLPGPNGGGTGYDWPGMGILSDGLVVFGGFGGVTYQSRTLVCAMPCTATSSWTNAHKSLQAARSEMAYASGGATPTVYAIDGQGTNGVLATAERTT